MKQGSYFIKLVFTLILAFFVNMNLNAAIRYVIETGVGNNNGSSWENAYIGAAGLQSALAASSSGDEIWVAKGTYTETTNTGSAFTILAGVKVYGGFAGNEAAIGNRSDIHGVNKTTLTKDTQINTRIVLMTGGTAASLTTLDGVSVTGGAFISGSPGADKDINALGVGVYLEGNCFLNNSIVYENSLRAGAAVYVNDNSTVESSIIESNISGSVNGGYAGNNWGGLGVHLNGTNSKLLHSIVRSNSAVRSSVTGGGVVLRGGEVAGCIIEKNSTGTGTRVGGGIIIHNGTIKDSLIYNNKATGDGGGIYVYEGKNEITAAKIINCTVYGNTGTTAGIVANGTTEIKNCVAFDNKSKSNGVLDQISGTSEITNSAYVGATGISNIDLFGVVAADIFKNVDPQVNDFTLIAKSTLINAGDNTVITTATTDLAGKPRIWNLVNNGVVDIGAYEYQNPAERFVVYDGLTDVPINVAIPTIEAKTVTTDTRVPSSNWVVKYFLDSDFKNEVTNPSSAAVITYYVKAFDNSGHWNVANTASFGISTQSLNVLTINNNLLYYATGANVVGTVIPSSADKFIEKLTYSPAINQITETFGAKYEFIMPNSNVTISSTEGNLTATRYVSEKGSGDKNGYSWKNAAEGAGGLQKVLDDANSNEIWVAKGTYASEIATNAFTIPSGMKVYGGFEGTENLITERNNIHGTTTSKTILTKGPQANTRIVTVAPGTANSRTILDGMRIEGGSLANITRGAGIEAFDYVTISNCHIISNTLTTNYNIHSENHGGGGIWINGANSIIDSCRFESNTATGTRGSAIWSNGGGTISNCIVTKSSSTRGAPLCVANGGTIESCSVHGNDTDNDSDAAAGSGIVLGEGGTFVVNNCAIYGNNANGKNKANGAALRIMGGIATVTNCTIYGNTSNVTSEGSAISGNATVSNTVIFGNIGNTEISGNSTFTNCAYAGATGESNIDLTGAAATDIFTDAAANNFILMEKSKLINAGDNTNIAVDAKDLAGNARIAGSDADANSKVDIGAYEYHSFASISKKPTIGRGQKSIINVTPPAFTTATANAWKYEVYAQVGDLSGFKAQTGFLTASGNEYVTGKIDGLTDGVNYFVRVAEAHRVLDNNNSPRYIIISNWSDAAKVVVTSAQDVVVSHENGIFSWKVSAENGVARYEVVDQTGKIIATVMPNGDLNYQIEAEGDLRLVIIDVDGTRQTFHPDRDNVATVSLNIEKGWNLIAVPFENADLKNLNRAVGNTYWSWNGEHYEVMQSELVPLEGFWVYSTKNQEITISGKRMASTEKELNVGWNLCGPTNNIAVPNVESVFGWDVKNESNVEVEKTLLQGRGYWFFTIENTVIKL